MSCIFEQKEKWRVGIINKTAHSDDIKLVARTRHFKYKTRSADPGRSGTRIG